MQAQQHDPARVKEFVALKRVLREGYNWCVRGLGGSLRYLGVEFGRAVGRLLSVGRDTHTGRTSSTTRRGGSRS